MPPSRRDDLVDKAMKLFHRRGFHATGIDRILEEAGVAKMTLYNHFRSKEDLILAALARRDDLFFKGFTSFVEDRAPDPKGRLLAVFDALAEWFRRDDFCGCMFISAACEYPRPEDPIHQASIAHKHRMREYVRSLAEEAASDDPDALADQLSLLIDGAIIAAHIAYDKDAARHARNAADAILEVHLPAARA